MATETLVKDLDTGEMMVLDLSTGTVSRRQGSCESSRSGSINASPTIVTTTTTTGEEVTGGLGEGEETKMTQENSASSRLRDYRQFYEAIKSSHASISSALKQSEMHGSCLVEKIEGLSAALKHEERAIRSYVQARSEVLGRMKDLASAAGDEKLCPILESLTGAEEAERERLESICSGFASLSSEQTERWVSTLNTKMDSLYKCQRAASSDLVHYEDKFDGVLSKEEDNHLLGGQEHTSTTTASSSPDTKIERNRQKLCAAHNNYYRSVESIVGAVRTSCQENWIELSPILLAYLNFEIGIPKKQNGMDLDQDSLQLVADIMSRPGRALLADRINDATLPVVNSGEKKSSPRGSDKSSNSPPTPSHGRQRAAHSSTRRRRRKLLLLNGGSGRKAPISEDVANETIEDDTKEEEVSSRGS